MFCGQGALRRLVIMSRVYKIEEFIKRYMLCVGIPREREGGLSQLSVSTKFQDSS